MPYFDDLYYSDHGTNIIRGAPLVLIHGAGGTGLFWPPTLRRIRGYRVLAPDLPGHGKSGGADQRYIEGYASSVYELVRALEVESVVIAGHSMGSAIALWLALERPELVSGLILVGAGAKLRIDPRLLALCAEEDTYLNGVQLVTSYSFSSGAPRNLVELAEKRMAETPRAVLYGDFLACDSFDVMDRVGEIEQPALIICGEEDRMTPPRYAEYLEERLKNAKLVLIPGAGHMVMLEQAVKVQAAVQSFLATQDSG
jgi:pimeloyl-ACP methyl ester carboxylesterase